jgi:hypothetical protein
MKLAGAALALLLVAPLAHAQSVLCCNLNINVDGDWFGSLRVDDCQKYLDEAPIDIARPMCSQRGDLKCLDTRRCDALPEFRDTTAESDRRGLEEGFYDEPPKTARRIVALAPTESTSRRTFRAWLDAAGCPLEIDARDDAAYAIDGRIARRDGKTRVEASARKGETKIGPVSVETRGDDSDAVATAWRGVLRRLKLICE